jgi:hypothetical protein
MHYINIFWITVHIWQSAMTMTSGLVVYIAAAIAEYSK